MSLSVALNNALTGLNINQKALEVLSHNIANANTEGYSRQNVEQAALYFDGDGRGVKIADILRKVDGYLVKSTQRQNGEVGYSSTIKDFNDRLQIILGEPGDTNTLDEYTSNFFDALQALAETPERISFRENAVTAGETLANELSGLATSLEQLRMQADADLSNAVGFVNQQLRDLDSLNEAIANATALGNPVAGLQDQQDIALKKISEYINIQTTLQDNGEIHVYVGNGAALLDDGLYQLSYRQANDMNIFTQDGNFSPLQIQRYDNSGNKEGEPVDMITAGKSADTTTILKSGSMKALKDLRDEVVPDILAQLDQLASVLRDQMNAIHNDGSAYPGTNELTGTRLVSATDRSDWSGNVMIGLLDENGQPVTSNYDDELYTGMRPLNLDLSFLDSGYGEGQPTVQTIIDEINNHFFPPPVKAEVGNFNNIQLVSDTQRLPAIPPLFSFDFDIDNISADDGDFYVTGVTVLDDTATDITNVTTTRPTVALDATNTFVTTAGSGTVTVNAANHGLAVGDVIYMPDPGGAVDGITQGQLTGYFTVKSINGAGQFTIDTTGVAGGVSPTSVAGLSAVESWDTIKAGEKARVRDEGTITADLTGNPGSTYYDITVNVGVRGEGVPAGQIKTAQITYRIYNNESALLNDRYNNTALSGQGARVVGSTPQPYMRAMLVDENGNEIPSTNGVYSDQPGYLKIETMDPDHTVAINEQDSRQLGHLNYQYSTDQEAGTNRHFSHYFELNNFFQSNDPSFTGDTVKGSALNLKVEQRILDNANLISLGKMVLSNQSADPNDPPQYTYERYSGDNSTIQAFAKAGLRTYQFAQAGGLDSSNLSFINYVGEILGYQGSQSAISESALNDDQILLDGFEQRLDNMKGVNVDEELANTVIYQSAYQASARIITVTNQLFDALLQSVGN